MFVIILGRAHCDILLNICESVSSKLVDGRNQPIISCLKYITGILDEKNSNCSKIH